LDEEKTPLKESENSFSDKLRTLFVHNDFFYTFKGEFNFIVNFLHYQNIINQNGDKIILDFS